MLNAHVRSSPAPRLGGLCVQDFTKKFKEKTSNTWDARTSGAFVKKAGKYQLVEVEDDGGDGDGGGGAVLGKLTREQIEKGQAVLEKVRACACTRTQVESLHLHASPRATPTHFPEPSSRISLSHLHAFP